MFFEIRFTLFGGREYVDEHTFCQFASEGLDLAFLELYYPINESEKSIISTLLYILSRMKFGAALTDDDVAFIGLLAAIDLHAEALGNRIAT